MATGFRNLTVYKKAFALAMDIYHVNKKFPEKYKKPSLQIADGRLSEGLLWRRLPT